MIADSGVPETQKKFLSEDAFSAKGTNWEPVERGQTGNDFSTCANQICQGKIQKKLLGPEPKSVTVIYIQVWSPVDVAGGAFDEVSQVAPE